MTPFDDTMVRAVSYGGGVLAVAMWLVAVPLAGLLWVEAGHASEHGRPVWAAVLACLAFAVAAERGFAGRLHARQGRR